MFSPLPCSGLLPRLPRANPRCARGEQRGSNAPCSAGLRRAARASWRETFVLRHLAHEDCGSSAGGARPAGSRSTGAGLRELLLVTAALPRSTLSRRVQLGELRRGNSSPTPPCTESTSRSGACSALLLPPAPALPGDSGERAAAQAPLMITPPQAPCSCPGCRLDAACCCWLSCSWGCRAPPGAP